MDAAWSDAQGLLPAVTCISAVGFLLGVVVEISWLVARWLLLLCYPVLFELAGGCSLILLFLPCLIVTDGLVGQLSLFGVLLSGLLLGCQL